MSLAEGMNDDRIRQSFGLPSEILPVTKTPNGDSSSFELASTSRHYAPSQWFRSPFSRAFFSVVLSCSQGPRAHPVSLSASTVCCADGNTTLSSSIVAFFVVSPMCALTKGKGKIPFFSPVFNLLGLGLMYCSTSLPV